MNSLVGPIFETVAIVATTLTLQTWTTPAFASECALSSKPSIIAQSEHELHQFWLVQDSGVFTSETMPESAALSEFLATIKSKIPDTNPDGLLRKEYRDFMNSQNPQLIAEAPNMILPVQKAAGRFHAINCLEALLLDQQVARGLSWANPMEFSAFILKRTVGSQNYLKIYYSTMDRPGGKMNSQVLALMEEDINAGWNLTKHLHNHTFNTPVANGIILVGGPSPGLSDVQLYRELGRSMGLPSAAVTNGFDTLEINSPEFFIFHTR